MVIFIKALKQFLMTLAVLVLIAVLSCLAAFGLAVSEVDEADFSAVPLSSLPGEILSAVAVNNECFIDENSLNSYIAYMLEGFDNGDDTKITGVSIDCREGETCRVYVRIESGEFEYTAAADCDLKLGSDCIEAVFSNVTVGKLPVPALIVKQALSEAYTGSLGQYIRPETPGFEIPAHFGMNMGESGELVSIDIIELETAADGIRIGTNPVFGDMLDNAVGMLKDYLFD